MAKVEKRGGRGKLNKTRQRKRKHDSKQLPYEDIVESAFRDKEHKMGFTRDTILKYLFIKYGVLDKKSVMLKINAAIRNGIKNGALKQLSGTGISGTFRLVGTKTKPRTKDSKSKHPNQGRGSTSRVDTHSLLGQGQATQVSGTDIAKTYLRKRKQMATKKETKKALMTRKSTALKKRRDVAKKLTSRPDRQAKTDTSGRKRTTLMKGNPNSPSELSDADTADQKLAFPEFSYPKTTSFTGSVMDKINVDQMSSGECSSLSETKPVTNDPKIEQESSQETVLEGTSASRTWPFMGFKPKSSIPVELEHTSGPGVGGMVVLSDGRRLIADELTLRLYSREINPLSFLAFNTKSIFGRPILKKIQDIAIFSETVAIILLHGIIPEIQFIDNSSETLSAGQSVNLMEHYLPRRITACRGYIFFTCHDPTCIKPSSVKKMDTEGKVYWSVSNTKQGEHHYNPPYCIESFVVDNSVRLVVTGSGSDACITVLDGESGEILFFRQGENCMSGLATDAFNNIYLFNSCGWVSVMRNDLSEERIILTTPMFTTKYNNALAHDLDWSSWRIAFDRKSNSLLVLGGPQISNASIMLQLYQLY